MGWPLRQKNRYTMNRKSLGLVFIAVLIALGLTLWLTKMIGNNNSAQKLPPVTRLVAAADNIKLGAVLTRENLTTIEVVGPAPAGAIEKPEQAIGRGVISDLYKGEAILSTRLSQQGGGLMPLIPQGMRAIAVRVDDVVNVSGFATPGMHVDVIFTGVPPDTGNGGASQVTISRTVLQNIKVLSAGTDFQTDAEGKPKQVNVVNLLVTPDQAEVLSLANGGIKIQLVLRNLSDNNSSEVAATDLSTALGHPIAAKPVAKAAAPAHAKPAEESIEVLSGSGSHHEKFKHEVLQ